MSLIVDGSKGISYDSPVGVPGGRLTLTTGTPVMTATVSGATTIYYTPYLGALIPIYDGSLFRMQVFSELSQTTTDVTKNPTAIGVSQNYDWFVWDDNGTLRLSHGPVWTSDTVRSAGTALVRVNGIWLNNAAITNACAAQRGTYVGSTRSNASSTLDWILGGIAVNGTAGFLGVWNAYNRRPATTRSGDSTDSWTYGTATFQSSHGSTTMRTTWVTGLAEDAYIARFQSRILASSTGAAIIGIGLDSTSAATDGATALLPINGDGMPIALLSGQPVLGTHFVQALERSNLGNATFYGDAGDATVQQNNLNLIAWM